MLECKSTYTLENTITLTSTYEDICALIMLIIMLNKF